MSTQRRDLDRAIRLVRGLVITLTRRRPKGFSAWEADAAQSNLQEALLRMRVVANCYEKHQGEMPEEVVSA